MSLVNVTGTLLLRASSDPNKQEYFAAGIIAYVIGAVFYVNLLKHNSLAVMAVASSTLQLGLMISLSVWYFDEKVSMLQGSAMMIAVVAAGVAMLAAAH
ncbi:hypothetical protein [uncultured Roseobacter sp.]|uniref:hypothetical protein n=1 Tax=uncultured Roseobacter sp. TaxID=114847 RepID=UPI00261A4ADB|nr:hypothetical protein [uncultured Roseobacter sp.]